MSLCAILGSSFQQPFLNGERLLKLKLAPEFSDISLYQYPIFDDAFVIFRHGVGNHLLPHLIQYKQQVLLLKELGCRALLVTGSVGVLEEKIPLFTPLVISDLLMPDNRLPDGTACTVFDKNSTNPGHLVIQEGLFSHQMNQILSDEIIKLQYPLYRNVVFAYALGPRTKTRAENFYWHTLGAHVNSMTIAPEIILANECEIPTACVVVGHKYSGFEQAPQLDSTGLTFSLEKAKYALEKIIVNFFSSRISPSFKNFIYRFNCF